MTSERIVWARPDSSIAVTLPEERAKAPAESRDNWMARVEGKAHVSLPGAIKIGMADAEKQGLLNGPDFKVGDRSCRDAWKVNALTGKLFVDFEAARRIVARRFIAEGAELRRFIKEELRPVARVLSDTNTLDLLMQAEVQIGAVEAAMPEDFSKMTGAADVAAYKPAWPTLEN